MTCNLWVEVGLDNGALGYVEYIFYMPSWKPHQLPLFTIVISEKYISVPFDRDCPNIVHITPIVRANIKEIYFKMA